MQLCFVGRATLAGRPTRPSSAKFSSAFLSSNPCARRLVEVPFQLDWPYWVEDPDFDLEFHIRATAIPSPGGLEQLRTVKPAVADPPGFGVVERDDLVAPIAQSPDDPVELGDRPRLCEIAEVHDGGERALLVLGEVGAVECLEGLPGGGQAGVGLEDGDEPGEGFGFEVVGPSGATGRNGPGTPRDQTPG